MNWETIVFFGDSLTFGARSYLGFPEYTGYILSKKLSKDWNIINHATNGFRAIDLVRSIDKNHSTLASCTPLMSIILIGTNDAKAATSSEEYTIALEQLIIKTKLITLNKNILLLHIPLFDIGVSYPYNIDMNKAIQDYNNTIEKLAEKHNAKTLSILLESKHYYDGVHFNKEGTQYISNCIANFILNQRGF